MILRLKKIRLLRGLVLFAFLFLVGGLSLGYAQDQVMASSMPYDIGSRHVAKNAMVSSGHELASEAGKKVLQMGGNAIDAAVATSFAIGVVEPAMSGIGGGGGMLIWLNDKKESYYIDHYPGKRASTHHEVDKDKEKNKLWEIGIPGTVAGLLHAQEKFGKLSRQDVMAPAIKLAREGFPMYPLMAHYIEIRKEIIDRWGGKNLFRPNGETFKIGEIFKQEVLANTLQKISDEGASAFYNGSITKSMVKILNDNGIPVKIADFKDYKVNVDKAPLTTTYKNKKVLSAPPPQGGLEIIEALNILDQYNMKEIGLPSQSPHAFHILTAALRAATADRVFTKDPDWVKVPTDILISKEYAKARGEYAMQVPVPYKLEAGYPYHLESEPFDLNEVTLKDIISSGSYLSFTETDFNAEDSKGWTTSLSTVDADGNAVALTQTISGIWGANGVWVDGFFFNNSATDFSELGVIGKTKSPNEYRIRYSPIAPTIILNEDNTVKLVIGSPGGNRISGRIVQNILYMLDYGMDAMTAARMPQIFPMPWKNTMYVEQGFNGRVYEDARKNGYEFYINFGVGARIYSILRQDGYWIGVADPYQQGGAAGY